MADVRLRFASRSVRILVVAYRSTPTPVNTPRSYLDVARKLGNLLADGGHMTVNGAGRVRVFW